MKELIGEHNQHQLRSFKLIKVIFSDESDVKLLIIDFEANQLARKHF